MFGSPSVLIHILRGILGLAFLAIALQYSSSLGWWVLAPLAAALICLGGCPMCWTVGLLATILQRKSRHACQIEPGSAQPPR